MTTRADGKRGAHKAVKICVVVADGIDPLNPKEETYMDITVFDDMKLASVHQTITKILQLKDEEKYTYSLESSKQILDPERTFGQIGVNQGEKLFMETPKRKRKNGSYNDGIGTGDEEVLELVCTTRIFDNDATLSSPIRRVRVIVLADQLCRELIADVSSLWGRTGLKFKCGRTVLQPNKTFEEQGVENGAEIVVTGGRG